MHIKKPAQNQVFVRVINNLTQSGAKWRKKLTEQNLNPWILPFHLIARQVFDDINSSSAEFVVGQCHHVLCGFYVYRLDEFAFRGVDIDTASILGIRYIHDVRCRIIVDRVIIKRQMLRISSFALLGGNGE